MKRIVKIGSLPVGLKNNICDVLGVLVGHSTIDKDSKKLLNRVCKPVIIGNHCWLGCKAIITKNARLPNNTIVGAGSVVCKPFEQEYIALAGNPAKIVKENVDWERCKAHNYTEDIQE